MNSICLGSWRDGDLHGMRVLFQRAQKSTEPPEPPRIGTLLVQSAGECVVAIAPDSPDDTEYLIRLEQREVDALQQIQHHGGDYQFTCLP
ncbi:MAG: hypothetical protein J0L84_01780 [Verrucomicrobia bacterium]|nr:hypothetical protein [Verrucomicrobiota bacterium]